MKRLLTMLCAAAICAVTAFGVSTNTWKAAGRVNDWDWTEPGNFVEGVAPEAGDSVKLPASTDIFVTNAASLSITTFPWESWLRFRQPS